MASILVVCEVVVCSPFEPCTGVEGNQIPGPLEWDVTVRYRAAMAIRDYKGGVEGPENSLCRATGAHASSLGCQIVSPYRLQRLGGNKPAGNIGKQGNRAEPRHSPRKVRRRRLGNN